MSIRIAQHRRVVTIMNGVHDYGRRALEGVARYGNVSGGWTLSLHHEEHVRQRMPKLVEHVDGVIAHAHAPSLIDRLATCGLPVVNTSSVGTDLPFVSVLPDDEAIGVMAAEEMIERGYRRLLVLDVKRFAYAQRRACAFEAVASRLGAHVTQVRTPNWAQAEVRIGEALAGSATPVGVFAVSDGLAVLTVRRATCLGLAMPEQVAVLGVDNDTLTTRMMSPTISSIELPWEKLGFEAAARLDRMIRGESIEPRVTLVGPSAVVTRQTTDGMAVEDDDVAEVLRRVRERMSEAFSIPELLDGVPVSRRAMELRFKRAVGRTLQQHVARVRVERAKQLLTETDFAMPEVAAASGFSDAAYFAAVFRRSTGTTPTAYRSGYRLA